ncbi:MAG: glycosyltransferase [Acetobacteraceae bacterium]|nr:glycosyltransferase [Acetobacteraceae bacterium]
MRHAAGRMPPSAAGALRLAGAEAASVLVRGWLAPDPLAPEEAPEVGLEIPGWGTAVVAAEEDASPEDGAPPGARGFLWRVSPPPPDGRARPLHAWHLSTGQELAGSPLALPAAAAVPAPAGPPLARWQRGLAGRIGAAAPQPLAEGLWVAGFGAAALLRYELILDPDPAGRPARGVRLLSEGSGGRIDVHFRLPPLPPGGGPVPVALRAWLPVAAEPFAVAQAELWLSAREGDALRPLRRLRRHRLLRSPGMLTAELAPEGDAEASAELWLTLSVAGGLGVSALAPSLGTAPEPAARLEDWRLEEGFRHLAGLIRQHGRGGEEAVGLLPPPPSAAPAPPVPATPAGPHPFTQVILPVHDGGAVVRDCLRALRAAATGPCQVIVVDDGSRAHTAGMLRQEDNRGYTKSVNEGVLLAEAPWLVVLNSDTLVPRGWLDRLHAAARARPGTGMVGPLSNAASWQSIPETRRPDGSWSTNDAIGPGDVARIQALLDRVSERAYPEFPVLNGFATLISREVFAAVGLYDEDAFPMGYGEETDLCLRARRAGFRLAVADDCFVFHHKSVSFGAGRARLTRAGNLELANKHLGLNTAALELAMQSSPPLARLRLRLAELLAAGGRE